jgi:uncharacterized protein (TIGR03067 family)
MVLIFSANANESAQVRREVERAISKGLIVLPFRIENISPAGAMEYALSNTHWLDGFTKPVERQFDRLATSVESLLAKEPEKVAEPPAPAMDRSLLPYGRLAIAAAIGVLAVIGAGALIGMFRGGSGPAKPNSEIADEPKIANREQATPRDGQQSQFSRKAAPRDGQQSQFSRKIARTDEERVQGRWEVVNDVASNTAASKQTATQKGAGSNKQTAKKKGGRASQHLHDKDVWVFEGPHLTIRRTVDGEEQDWIRGTFTLRIVGERKLIDYDSEGVNGHKIEWRGIYSFNGPFLEVCWRPKSDSARPLLDRPNSFVVNQDNHGFYMKLSRTRGG